MSNLTATLRISEMGGDYTLTIGASVVSKGPAPMFKETQLIRRDKWAFKMLKASLVSNGWVGSYSVKTTAYREWTAERVENVFKIN